MKHPAAMMNELQVFEAHLKKCSCGGNLSPSHEIEATFYDMLDQTKIKAKREEVLKEMGVTQQDLAQTVGIDKDVPYLLNMNEDPALSGKMMYFLPPGQPIKIGAHADNKIVLQGLGVPDYLCEIENLGEQGVVVRTCQQPHTSRLSMKARVCVNGSAMTGDEQRKLKAVCDTGFDGSQVWRWTICSFTSSSSRSYIWGD
eukprot:s296_g10.t1